MNDEYILILCLVIGCVLGYIVTANTEIFNAQEAVEWCEKKGNTLKEIDHFSFRCSDGGEYTNDVLEKINE